MLWWHGPQKATTENTEGTELGGESVPVVDRSSLMGDSSSNDKKG